MNNEMFISRHNIWQDADVGCKISSASCAKEALELCGLNHMVYQQPIYTADGTEVVGYKANVHENGTVLGVVSNKYKILQNKMAYEWLDMLYAEGCRFDFGGMLQNGKINFITMKLQPHFIDNEKYEPFILVSTSHSGASGLRIQYLLTRVSCCNMLPFLLKQPSSFSIKHSGKLEIQLEEAKQIIVKAEKYIEEAAKEIMRLKGIYLGEEKALQLLEELLPIDEDAGEKQKANILRTRQDLRDRYYAPDLLDVDHNGFRYLNSVADYTSHALPKRLLSNYKQGMMIRVMESNTLFEKAMSQVNKIGVQNE